MNEDKQYRLTNAVQKELEKELSKVRTAIPVQVTAVDLAKQTVTVQPIIMGKRYNKNSKIQDKDRMGNTVLMEDYQLPAITNVPILCFRAGAFMITLPITVGDQGILLVCDRDISNLKAKGGAKQPQASLRRFNLSDGIYLPFLPNAQNKAADYSTSAMVVTDGATKMTFDASGTIKVTGGDVTVDNISVKNHTHPISVPSTPYSGDTGAPE